MASSKLKAPPPSYQKTTIESDSTATDNGLFTAFKKLRVDVNGSCVNKCESHTKDALKHKPDSNIAEDQRQIEVPASDNEEWSKSLQQFCFCDEGAINKNGRAKWRSMCRYHQLRMRKGNHTVNGKNSLNLAQAVRAHKPLLQEGRLKLADSKKKSLPVFMRCARFEFSYKPSKLSENKDNKEANAPSVKTQTCVTATTGVSVKGSNKEVAASTAKREMVSPARPVFAAGASEKLPSFSSLQTDSSDSTQSNKGTMPTFEGYRNTPVRCHLPILSHNNCSGSGTSSSTSVDGTATVGVSPPRVEVAVERSCSQEARLDEGEFSVNELAAYFDNYLYMPKEMSSMAQMMYT